MMHRVLVVAPEGSPGLTLARALRAAGCQVVEAGPEGWADAAGAGFDGRPPDALFADASGPGADPALLLRHLSERARAAFDPGAGQDGGTSVALPLRIALLSARHLDPDGPMRELPAFLDDFLTPPYDPAEALARLRLLLFRRRHVEGGDRVRYHDLTLDLAAGRAYAAGSTEEIALTPREWDLLRFLVTNQGRRYGRDRLVDLVWGVHYDGGARTVDIHIRRLRAKLPPEAGRRLETLRGIGYGFAAVTTSNPRRGGGSGG